VDPGGDAELLLARIRELGLTVRQILITHGHFDHVLAAGEIQRATGAKIAIHRKDRWLYLITPVQTKLFGGKFFGNSPPRPNRWLCEGDVIKAGTVSAHVMHTPGHSPGSCCFHVAEGKTLFSGDTLFANSIGNWRFPGGSAVQIFKSFDRLFELPDETQVVPGHGPETTIGAERASNPYRDANFRAELMQQEAKRPGLVKSIFYLIAATLGLVKKKR